MFYTQISINTPEILQGGNCSDDYCPEVLVKFTDLIDEISRTIEPVVTKKDNSGQKG